MKFVKHGIILVLMRNGMGNNQKITFKEYLNINNIYEESFADKGPIFLLNIQYLH